MVKLAVDLKKLEQDGGQRSVNWRGQIVADDDGPIVIVGPNGSGKTKRSRELGSDTRLDVINALRNTRVNTQLQPMARSQAKQNLEHQLSVAMHQPYELVSDFDFILTALIGDAAETGLQYLTAQRQSGDTPLPPLVALEQIQQIWSKILPGRELLFENYVPTVRSQVAVPGNVVHYNANEMSDGEKAALYLAGRVFLADYRGVLVVDEPETHFHSLLAIEFWDAIEAARPDIRLIYVTHDIVFAKSRRKATILVANPAQGLVSAELSGIPEDLAESILGAATISFYARRVVFCEGDETSLDKRLYTAWYGGAADVVIRPVGSCEMVYRAVTALKGSGLVVNLDVLGIVDSDFHSDVYLASLPEAVGALRVHEAESILALPEVVTAVAKYLDSTAVPDLAVYEKEIRAKFNDAERHRVVVERWKRRVQGQLTAVVSSVTSSGKSLDETIAEIPGVFDQGNWSFSPEIIFGEEKTRVEGAFASSKKLSDLLALMPGKSLVAIAAGFVGLSKAKYVDLVINALGGGQDNQKELTLNLRAAMKSVMPPWA